VVPSLAAQYLKPPEHEESKYYKAALSRNGNRNGTRPKRVRDQAAKKQWLERAALELFASKGYEVTTTREIAASAGCAEGLIHRYFKGKAGLLAALMEYPAWREVLDLGHQLRPAPKFEDEFLRLVDREVEHVWESRDFLRVFLPRTIVNTSVASDMNQAIISARVKEISERLTDYESCATLSPDAMEALAHAVGTLGLVFGFVRPVLLGQNRLRAKKMAGLVARVFVGNSVNSSVI
jgi:AcrR family transcriptional regulator